MKIKKGDTVIVMVGRDSGRKGKVEKVFPKEGYVLVAGVNMYKKHMKKRDEKTPAGIIDLARPLNSSKVAVVCPSCGKPTRIGYRVTKGQKERMCKKCEQKL